MTRKHSFRLVFKDEYGPSELEFPLLGEGAVDEFNTVVLQGDGQRRLFVECRSHTLQYARDQFGHSLQQCDGLLRARTTRYAHLYINGMYWGLYSPHRAARHRIRRQLPGHQSRQLGRDSRRRGRTRGDFVAWNAMLAKTAQAG